MFISKNKVRMHDTDMAGILYFPKQFRFCHEALEDFVESQGLSFNEVFNEKPYVFVIRHCEADYFAPLYVGDDLLVELRIESIGTSSFVVAYKIFKEPTHTLIGTAQTVHVTLDNVNRTKIPVPDEIRATFEKNMT
jgi:1,4-dihydroxy-2-naphthoyl-CoA hydrolase